ncbi:hypothetical protein PV10_09147 [Exophiala mesophila]|uniref:NAD-dependent epimerase/dehydratase domain-containing protein n=1 Tax=Exophiala mesophila TaxID=212818 RepID=A0A0D1WHD6_EXOME|nr:uncharacterized protein PV10_09147 [Exophiala mesophila]KIV88230.1 hypothetical protein PV10_09147 [Exophiala mesophila]
MSHRILLTGASGYLGGTLLARWSRHHLPPYSRLYAAVRTEQQVNALRNHYSAMDSGAEVAPLILDNIKDQAVVRDLIVSHEITIVLFLIDAFEVGAQCCFIRALAEVKSMTGREVHFLHTSGAKVFSSHAGAPTDRLLFDDEEDLYKIQKEQVPNIPPVQTAINTNNTIIELCESLDVKGYIFVPCIVYGEGEGFGNPISIQTVAIVSAAQEAGRVYSVDSGKPTWPVCHVLDNTALYLAIVNSILTGKNSDQKKCRYYLAASGTIAWVDLYRAIGEALTKRGVISDNVVEQADEDAMDRMAKGLKTPRELVALQLGGALTARSGEKLGWKPQFGPTHILQTADDEVERILAYQRSRDQ